MNTTESYSQLLYAVVHHNKSTDASETQSPVFNDFEEAIDYAFEWANDELGEGKYVTLKLGSYRSTKGSVDVIIWGYVPTSGFEIEQ